MSTDTQNYSLIFNMAVSETTNMESKTAQHIYEVVQNAVDRDAAVLYMGNNETIEVPFIAHIRQMHPDFVSTSEEDYNGPFEGWDFATKLYMVEASRCNQDTFIDFVTKHFSPELISIWAKTLKTAQDDSDFPIFLGSGCAAIHVDNSDGSWFEYIIECDYR